MADAHDRDPQHSRDDPTDEHRDEDEHSQEGQEAERQADGASVHSQEQERAEHGADAARPAAAAGGDQVGGHSPATSPTDTDDHDPEHAHVSRHDHADDHRAGSSASVHSSARVSLASDLDPDDRTPTVAHSEQFSPVPHLDDDPDDRRDNNDDDVPPPVARTIVSTSPTRHRRPFSLVSEPDSPSTASLSTLDSATSPARRPSLLASSMAASSTSAAADPTNVGRDSSASLTQAVWRQSMGLNSNPSALARGMVDVQLDNGEGDGESHLGEEAQEARRRKRRSAALSWNSAALASAHGSMNGNEHGGKAKRLSTQYRTLSDSATALAPPFEEEDEASDAHSLLARSPASPTRSHSFPTATTSSSLSSPLHGRSGSISTAIATPHAADGFISHRASANLSSLLQPVSPANPPQSNTGIKALQANFESLRSLKQRQLAAAGGGGDGGDREDDAGIDWEFWGRVMSDYEGVARHQRESCENSFVWWRWPGVHGAQRMVWPARSERALSSDPARDTSGTARHDLATHVVRRSHLPPY